MTFSSEEKARLAELILLIEKNKTQDFGAPTYRDVPFLCEISDIVCKKEPKEYDGGNLLLQTLRFLAFSYDAMCRSAISVKYHNALILAEVEYILKFGTGASEIEDDFYKAVRARNVYGYDCADDLILILHRIWSEEKCCEALSYAINSCSRIKRDPIELSEKYLAVIDEVEMRIDKEKTVGICHEIWALKRRFLKEYGIEWSSPAVLNPKIRFD